LLKAVGYSACVLRGAQSEFICRGLTKREGSAGPNPNSIYELGSVTKLFTALLLRDMEARGVLALDDPVNAFLPSSVRVPSHEGDEVTLLHLATHSSGLPVWPHRRFIRPDDGQHPFSHFSIEDAYRFLGEVKLEFRPGSKWSYSNFGYALLGHILELVSGSSYQELVQTRICTPLGMKDTSVDLNAEQRRRICHGYSMRGAPKTRRRLAFMAPAGGLRSTAEDLARFLRQRTAEARSTLSKELRACMTIRLDWPLSRLKSYPDFADLRTAGQGLGWQIYSLKEDDLVCKGGGTRGFCSFIGLRARSKKGLVLLANRNTPDVVDVGIRALLTIS
jgi:CubicO group peptidase (beta-lactamase class C family)